MNDVLELAICALESAIDVSALENDVEELASDVSALEIVCEELANVSLVSVNGDESATNDGHSSWLAMQLCEMTMTCRDVSAVSDFDVAAVAFLHSGCVTLVSVGEANDSDLIHRVEDFSNSVQFDRCETSCDLDLSTAVDALCLATLDAYRFSRGNDSDVNYDFRMRALCDASRCHLLLICPNSYRSSWSFYN